MARAYPYPVMKQCTGIVGMEGQFWAEMPEEWYEGATLTWFHQMKGWTRSDNFMMQADNLGVSHDNLARICTVHDAAMASFERAWRLDATSRWESMTRRYYASSCRGSDE